MTWLDALWLGLIQGLTEYLPVSSSGHLEIANTLLGIKGSDNLTFAVLVHAATVCSTLVVLWKEIAALFAGVFRFKWNDETQYVSKIFLSMIPVGIVGVFFKDAVESVFGNGLLLVGIMLVVTALLLTFAHYARPRRKEKISYKDAFVIGLAQACAVLPGLSRSGTTIATGLMLGDKKEQVARFSFLMVIIPILGEAFLDLMKGGFSPAESGIPVQAMIVGFLAAFISGCVACKWMLRLVQNGQTVQSAKLRKYSGFAGTAWFGYDADAALPALAEANIRLLGQADGATVFAGFYDVAGRMLSAQVLGSAGAISPKAAPGGCTQVRFFAADAGLRPIAEPLTISGS